MFHVLFFNFTIVVSFLFLVSIVNKYVSKERNMKLRKLILFGIVFGVLGIILMYYSIQVTDTIIVDLRHLATILVAVYGGMIPALISAVIISISRIVFYGATSAGMIASMLMICIGVSGGLLFRLKVSRFYKFHIMNIVSLVIIFIALMINLGNFQAVIEVYKYSFFISFFGGFFIISVAEYLYQAQKFEDKLLRTSSRLSTLIESLQSGILLEDEGRRIRIVNDRFCKMFNLPFSPKFLVGQDCLELVQRAKGYFKDPELFEHTIEQCIKDKKVVTNIPIQLNNEVHLELDFVPIYKDKLYLGHFWNYRDVTERVQTTQRLRELSLVDGLTQVSNRRFFDLTIEKEMNGSNEKGTPLSLILFDIDYFKKYNDTYGHSMGDQTLIQVAKVAAQQVEAYGHVCRYGGEEFAIILPNTDTQQAKQIGEQLRNAINAVQIPHHSSEIAPHITISLGLTSEVVEKGRQKEGLIEKADQALYESKAKGRNVLSICE
ncbi:diguanylate cyclase [Bacillus tianshenii]|nr:diguanylate cyclase [Bacillus tianshenii]